MTKFIKTKSKTARATKNQWREAAYVASFPIIMLIWAVNSYF